MHFPNVLAEILLIHCAITTCLGFGFLTPIGVALGSIAAKAICHFKECCSEHSIHANFDGKSIFPNIH